VELRVCSRVLPGERLDDSAGYLGGFHGRRSPYHWRKPGPLGRQR
jgi:hypothetical protein